MGSFARGWLWMLWRFGPTRTFRYWQEGRRRGWMTREQVEEHLALLRRGDLWSDWT